MTEEAKNVNADFDKKFADYIEDGKKNIVIINGLKGGTGKSILALIIAYINADKRVIVIDMDMSNEDVSKSCGDVQFKKRIDGTSVKGWEQLDQIIHDQEFDLCIINTPAQFDASLEDFGLDWISETFNSDEFNLLTVWSLGSYRDSTLLLNKYLNYKTGEPVFVALSMHEVDDATDFEVFAEKQGSDNPLDLRGGSVFKHVRMPKKLLNRMKDGAKDPETGKNVRYSIKMFLDSYSKGAAGGFIKRPVLKALEQMRVELGYVDNRASGDDLDD